ILAGDIIAGIDGESVQGLSLEQTRDKIRGAPDTRVTLKILRGANKDPLNFNLTRAIIQVKSIRAQDLKYWTLLGLGDIKQRRGDLDGALKFYSDSLAIPERLAKSDPGNAEWQRDLS